MQLRNEYDIVVAGAGIAGISAAVKAASMGCSVLLVERFPFAGGMSSAGMVSPFMKSRTGDIDLVKGVFSQIEEHMRHMGGMIDNGFYAWSFRSVANTLLQEAGVDVDFGSDVAIAGVDNKSITSITLASRYGSRQVKASFFIDTTGDAQLVALASFPWLKGDEKTGKLQALTLFFRMGGIDVKKTAEFSKNNPSQFLSWMDFNFDFSKIISIAGYTDLVKKAQEQNRLSEDIQYIFFTSLPESGEASFNTSNILGIDASTSEGLTQAEKTGHQQVAQIVDFLQADVPGFENAFLIETAPQVGVRETRRAIADYMVNGEDILSGKKFDDAIARACYGIDIHGQKGEESRMEELGEGQWYDIPLRSLMVKEAENLLVAGRCIGATREGHAALRIMPTSAATGEACGAIAALAVKTSTPMRSLDYKLIKEQLIHNIEK